ncbi:MAG: arylesterase [Betaproteobacteria bacterium]|nr:arylesterase [Betaproteobacteria bacterium]
MTASSVAGVFPRWFTGLLTALMLFAFHSTSCASVSGQRIMVYGDSLSAAYGIDPKDGWVSLMQGKLKAENVEVVNSSVSGETSNGGLSRIKTDLAMVKPSIVVLALGANDALRGLPVAETRKNLQAMIAAITAAKAKVILVGIQIPPNYGIEYAQQFRDLYAELAKKNSTLLVPFLLDGIADKLELFQEDRLHPKAEAQPRILENVLPIVRKALPATPPTAAKRARP